MVFVVAGFSLRRIGDTLVPPGRFPMHVLLFLLGLSLCLTACASPPVATTSAMHQFEMGRPLNPAKVNQVIEGKTTEQEAIELLGSPQTIQQRPDGSKIFIFTHHQTRMSGPSFGDTQGGVSQEMLFLGIRNGIVMKKLQRSTQQPMRSFTGWAY